MGALRAAYDAWDREGYNLPDRLREAIEELAAEVGDDRLVVTAGCW